jgi:transcriptional antiterminator Rof (Rho-off)
MEHANAYQPIACDFHDRLESFATLRQRVRLSLKNGDSGAAEDLSAEGRIADIYTREDKQEFLRLDNGAEIRLDRILGISPVE